MKKQIYLAGSMEYYHGIGNKYAFEWRKEVADYFKENTLNFECIDPTQYYNFFDNYHKKSSEIMLFDLRKVKQSNVVLVDLNHIRDSLGTSDEIFYAWSLGIPIIGFLNKEFSSKEKVEHFVHSWKYEQVDRIETGANALLKACEYIKNFYG